MRATSSCRQQSKEWRCYRAMQGQISGFIYRPMPQFSYSARNRHLSKWRGNALDFRQRPSPPRSDRCLFLKQSHLDNGASCFRVEGSCSIPSRRSSQPGHDHCPAPQEDSMNCYVCAAQHEERAAVALCPNCSVALCLRHLHQAQTPSAGGTHLGCRHGGSAAAAARSARPRRRPTKSVAD